MEGRITMAHGAGGEVMHRLIKDLIVSKLGDLGRLSTVPLESLEDGAIVGDTVFSTDSHTVEPLFFPGGDIGTLSVAGTVNDISVMGGNPIALSLGLIIEEGFLMDDLERVIESVRLCSEEAGVPVVTGDTKVVEKGSLDGMVTNTAGIGVRHPLLDGNMEAVRAVREASDWPSDAGVREGDAIIISGTIGDHGGAIITSRQTYGFEMKVPSDVGPVNGMISKALEAGGISAMKDPTRGGVASSLNEWASKSNIGIMLDETQIPVRDDVTSVCDLLGIDPLEIANEGKVLFAVVPDRAEAVLSAINAHPKGAGARIIGFAQTGFEGVVLETTVGGRRYVDFPAGDPVPRIC